MFAIVNVVISTLLHKLLSHTLSGPSDINVKVCIETVFFEPKCFKIFICIQLAFGLFLILAGMSKVGDFSGKTNQLTDKITTPQTCGKFQHGSARWLKSGEYDGVYDTAILDIRNISYSNDVKADKKRDRNEEDKNFESLKPPEEPNVKKEDSSGDKDSDNN